MYTYTRTKAVTIVITDNKLSEIKEEYKEVTGVKEEEFDERTFECWLEDYMWDFTIKELCEEFKKVNEDIDAELKKER